MTTYTAYCRRSTNKQDNSIEAQLDVINAFITTNGGELVNVFTESDTGSNDRRPILQQAVDSSVSSGSNLIVSHCDRLSRNLFTIARLNNVKGLNIVVAELGSVQASTLMLNLRCVIAVEEREAIKRRIKDAFAVLRAKGVEFGRKDFGAIEGGKGRASYKSKCDAYAVDIMPRINALKLSGVTTYNAIASHLNMAGFTSVNGKRFYPSTIKNLILTYG